MRYRLDIGDRGPCGEAGTSHAHYRFLSCHAMPVAHPEGIASSISKVANAGTSHEGVLRHPLMGSLVMDTKNLEIIQFCCCFNSNTGIMKSRGEKHETKLNNHG